MTSTTVLVAGATGDLGHGIVRELLHHDTRVRVLTRPRSSTAHRRYADTTGVDIIEASYSDRAALQAAVSGARTVVSALSGTRQVKVMTHGQVTNATDKRLV